LHFCTPSGDLGETYTVHLRLTGKLLVDFLLRITEPFLLGATRLQVRQYEWLSIRSHHFWRGWSVWPRISGRRDVPHPPNILCIGKLDAWAFIWYKNVNTNFFHFVTFTHLTDGETDRWTDAHGKTGLHSCRVVKTCLQCWMTCLHNTCQMTASLTLLPATDDFDRPTSPHVMFQELAQIWAIAHSLLLDHVCATTYLSINVIPKLLSWSSAGY